jgi:hypothetical protein
MVMRQRGRRSAANLVTLHVDVAPARLEPPACLNNRERKLFSELIAACDPRHFVESDLPLHQLRAGHGAGADDGKRSGQDRNMGFSRALTGDVGDPAALGTTSAHRSEDHRAARYRAAARYCTVGGLNMRNTRGDRNGHWIEAHGQTPGCWMSRTRCCSTYPDSRK